VVFVGKSLTAHGGQNPAEAVAAGKAVVVGPNMENFRTLVSQLVRARGIHQVADAAALEARIAELLADAGQRAALAANGAQCLVSHRGATARTCEAVLRGRGA
jgi:3-deoxy-D-manno-octulosonic-acid transferase